WGDRLRLRFGDSTRTATVATTFAGIGGGVGLVVDSYGMLAVALDRRPAAADLGLAVGDAVHVSAAGTVEGTNVGVAFPTRR
ncbi:MAG TPA: hypothetical protein VF855_02485, partial [Acidimicrobiales bacterium]